MKFDNDVFVIEAKQTKNGNFLAQMFGFDVYFTNNGKVLTVWDLGTQWDEFFGSIKPDFFYLDGLPSKWEVLKVAKSNEKQWAEVHYGKNIRIGDKKYFVTHSENLLNKDVIFLTEFKQKIFPHIDGKKEFADAIRYKNRKEYFYVCGCFVVFP